MVLSVTQWIYDNSQSLYAGDDGVERSLDVGCGAGADHRQMVVLQHVWKILREEKKKQLGDINLKSMLLHYGHAIMYYAYIMNNQLPSDSLYKNDDRHMLLWSKVSFKIFPQLSQYVRKANRKQSRSHVRPHVLVFLTWPCQSDVLMRMMLSGRWLSDTRMWFSWSYTVFLGIYAKQIRKPNFLAQGQ